MLNVIILVFNFGILNQILSKKGRCYIIPDNDSGLSGLISFDQSTESSPVTITMKIFGAKSIHGFHIHEKGSIESGCISAGAHYNPLLQNHGGPDSTERHMGDLGNIFTTDGNKITHQFVNDKISLYGEYSILGRTCVVHAYQDDLGSGENEDSLKTGNSGPRLACGIVQTYDPLNSILFGISILIIGTSLSIYYFFCLKKNSVRSEIVENSSRRF